MVETWTAYKVRVQKNSHGRDNVDKLDVDECKYTDNK